MQDEHGTVRRVAWRELFPWLLMIRAVRIALRPKLLVLSILAMLATSAGWRVIGWVFSGSEQPELHWVENVEQETHHPVAGTLSHLYCHWPWEWTAPDLTAEGGGVATGTSIPMLDAVYNATPARQLRGFGRMFLLTTPFVVVAYLLLCLLWGLFVWAFVGGAVTRVVTVSLTREERVTWGQATGHARAKLLSYFSAPLVPLVAIGLAAVVMAIGGLFLRFGLGVMLISLLWPLVLVGGFVMSVLLLGLTFGWPLMWATISTEGTDAFDALSRAYAYVFQRPLKCLAYVLATTLLGVLAHALVSWFVGYMITFSVWGMSWGSGGEAPGERVTSILADSYDTLREKDELLLVPGAALMRFWNNCLLLIPVAFGVSYFWSTATAAYLLLRRDVDGTEMDEVFLPDEDEQHGLPEIGTLNGNGGQLPVVDRPAGPAAPPASVASEDG